jgi:tRNA-dihydrouridine synthase
MGCPDNSVIKRGGGAGLIKTPNLAVKIIKSVKNTVKYSTDIKSKKFSVSVKTRTGINKHKTKEWIDRLLETELDFICLHGRTVVQGYYGRADWEEIGLAAELAQKTKTKILGNGDIKNRSQALEKIKEYKLEGVLIGRAALGNPWIFHEKIPMLNERLQVMMEHCQKFMKFFPQGNFKAMRKHLIWYAKGFRNSAKVREELMRVNNLNDVLNIIKNI